MIFNQDLFFISVVQDHNIHGATYNTPYWDIFNEAGVSAKATVLVNVGTNSDNFTTLKIQGTNDDPTGSPTWHDVDGTVVGTDLDVNGNVSTLPDTTFQNKIIGFTLNTNSGAYRWYRVEAAADSAGSASHIGVVVINGHRGNVALPQDAASGFAQLLCAPPVIPDTH